MHASLVTTAVLRYLGNPVVFFVWYLVAFENADLERALGAPAFEVVGTPIIRMDPSAFVVCTAPVYVGIMLLHAVAGRVFDRFDSREFFRISYRPASLILTLPGLANLWLWCTEGMEMNIMGIVFTLPLLAWSVFTLIYWCHSVARGLARPRRT